MDNFRMANNMMLPCCCHNYRNKIEEVGFHSEYEMRVLYVLYQLNIRFLALKQQCRP